MIQTEVYELEYEELKKAVAEYINNHYAKEEDRISRFNVEISHTKRKPWQDEDKFPKFIYQAEARRIFLDDDRWKEKSDYENN